MISPFHELITSEGINFEEHLKKIHLFKIFEPVFMEFQDDDLFRGVVKFILWGYSINSDMLNTSGNTWGKVAPLIFEKCELPKGQDGGIYEAVCELKSEGVRESIERWLQYQNNENFTNYTHYRDLRREFLALSISDMKKSTQEIDIEAKMKAALYSKELLKMMEDARETFIQNNSKLKRSVDAVNKVNRESAGRSAGSYAL
jgi:hypothetical protein